MFKRCNAILLICLLITNLLGFSVAASPQAMRNEIVLSCASQQTSERLMLFKQGLAQILARLSADSNIVHHDSVLKANAHIQDYVEQYQYEGTQLKVCYYDDMIADLLQAAGAKIVLQQRPPVIVWLAIEADSERHLVGAETDPDIYAALNQLSQEYDVPLRLPLMDLEDVTMVTVTDVWGQFTEVLQRASQRYEAPIILVGRLKQVSTTQNASNAWQADWTLQVFDQASEWHMNVTELQDMWPTVMHRLSKQLHQFYAVPSDKAGTQAQPLLVGIQGIHTNSDFKQVSRSLREVQGINAVALKQLDSHGVLFEIFPSTPEGKAKLAQRFRHEARLVTPALPHQSLAKADLVYEWEP